MLLTITLPDDVVDLVRTKVASGQYASESEVSQDGLRSLQEREAAFEMWLQKEVVASFDEYLADRTDAVPADQMMDRLRASYRDRASKAGA